MMQETPFELAVKHYCLNVLPECIPFIRGGQMVDARGKPFTEGKGENSHYTGFLIIYDGSILEEVARKMVLRPNKGFSDSTYVNSDEEFLKYFKEENKPENPDKTYFFNRENGTIKKYKGEISNAFPGDLERAINTDLPPNFLSEDGSIPLDGEEGVGTRVGISLIIPKVYDGVRIIMTKETPYGLGMGKLAHVDKYGLVEEFFFRYDSQSKGPFIDEEHKIVGVHRIYRDSDGRPTRDQGGNLIAFREETVDIYLRNAEGKKVCFQESQAGQQELPCLEAAFPSTP